MSIFVYTLPVCILRGVTRLEFVKMTSHTGCNDKDFPQCEYLYDFTVKVFPGVCY